MKEASDFWVQTNDTPEGERNIFEFDTELERDAFVAGLKFVNDSYLDIEIDGLQVYTIDKG